MAQLNLTVTDRTSTAQKREMVSIVYVSVMRTQRGRRTYPHPQTKASLGAPPQIVAYSVFSVDLFC